MKRSFLLVLAASILVGGAYAAVRATAFVRLPRAAAAGDFTLYGHVKKLTRKGNRFVLRFDPAWFTSGLTANTAAAEDGVIKPGEPVPNDNYIVDETHRLLSYVVPAQALVTC